MCACPVPQCGRPDLVNSAALVINRLDGSRSYIEPHLNLIAGRPEERED